MSFLQLLRPKQWVKNFFLFLPLFFGNALCDIPKLLHVVVAFFAFCLIASAIYCFNDIYDREIDRIHEKKRNRPVASGAISIGQAYAEMALCIVAGFGMCFLLPADCMWKDMVVMCVYLVINFAYCLKLKQFAIVDVFCVSMGFVLRLIDGGYAGEVELSRWIVIMTFLIALFMAFAKRRDDVVSYRNTGILVRSNVSGYNISFMNMVLAVIASMTMICYIMYTMSESVMTLHNSQNLYFTSIFVLAGLVRYLQLTIVYERSGSPTELILTDRFLQACVILWIASFAIIIYL